MRTILLILLFLHAQANAQIITTFAGDGTVGCPSITGIANASQVPSPRNVTVDRSGNLYINCWECSEILKVDPLGLVSVFAGNGVPGFSGDGGPATAAQFYETTGLAFADNGDIYIADAGNCRIRKMNSAGIVTTVAGTGLCGYGGDGGPATDALLNFPNGIAFDSRGNLYIAEEYNNTVRVVDTSGIIRTFAGTGNLGLAGDGGPATDAMLNNPCRVAVDKQDVVYIDDLGNHAIRKVGASGVISLFAGNYIKGFGGDGGPATRASLWAPVDIVFDHYGNVYISERLNNRIRRVNSSGVITTVAGNGSSIYSGDGGRATEAGLNDPIGVAVDSCGTIYISDFGDNRIRKVVMYPGCDGVPYNACPLNLPNAFTPDIDHLNNTFAPIALTQPLTNYSFSIFDRWGQRVFFTNDVNTGWNGNFNNYPADVGVYVYYIKCDVDGQACIT